MQLPQWLRWKRSPAWLKTVRRHDASEKPGGTGLRDIESQLQAIRIPGLGRLARPGTIAIALAALLILPGSFWLALRIMDGTNPPQTAAPKLTNLPPLPPTSRSSVIVAPVSIALPLIRDVAERNTPRNFAGKAENPAAQILQNADIAWSAARGPLTASGALDVLSLSTPITGRLNVNGSLSARASGAVGDALGSLLGSNAAKQIGSVNIKNVSANAEIKGSVTVTSRPKLAAGWYLEPNLGGKVSLGDTSLTVAGAKVNVPAQVKPVIDKTVGEQLNAVSERIRADQTLVRNARVQWAKACRSIPLQGADRSLPPLWLEMRPTRAIAAQPRVDAAALTLTIGIEADTRITPAQTKPNCPFPDKLTIVPPTQGGVSIGVPIDLPFVELNKILETQLAGKTFPEDGSGQVAVTVKRAGVAASGDRLLISLLVRAKEKASWFGLGAEATVHVWGVPQLDEARQSLRLGNIELAVESEAAFGLLGAAAKAAIPHLQRAIYDQATIDLKPFAANARTRIAEAIADFQRNEEGIRVNAQITSIRLAEIAFDSKTLRVVAEAAGDMNVLVSKLPDF